MYAEAVSVEDRLRTALSTGKLDAGQAARAEALLSRLVSPVRVAVLGRRRSGKSSVLNLLAGEAVVPLGASLPTALVSWGETPATTCTYADQTRKTFADASDAELARGQPVFIAIQRNLPTLRRVALLELVMDGAPSDQARALAWASARCDIAIWCTRDFDPVEQSLWAAMPAPLKKHAIMVLTHPDALEEPEERKAHLAHMQDEATGNFYATLPVDARAALSALAADATAEADAFAQSGAQAFLDAVSGKVDAGYNRVRDVAQSLLDEVVLNVARAFRPESIDVPPKGVSGAPSPEATSGDQAAQTPARDKTGFGPPAYVPPIAMTPPRATIHKSASAGPLHAPRAPHIVARDAPPDPAPAGAASGPVAAEAAAPAVPEASAPEPTAPAVPEATTPQPAAPETAAPATASGKITAIHDRASAAEGSPAEGPLALSTATETLPAEPATDATPPDVPEGALGAASPMSVPVAEQSAPVRLSDAGRETVQEAIVYLAKRGESWGKVARRNYEAASRQIMEEVLGDAEWLLSYLNDPFEDDEALIAPCRDMVADIVDLVQLMEIERTDMATIDAVCLLVQARRRLEALAAAA